MSKYTRLKPEKEAKVLKALRAGYTMDYIAKRMGITITQIFLAKHYNKTP